MIVKGIVESVISKNEVKVRIPILNGLSSQVDSTPTEQLSSSSICQLPNMQFELAIGDIVWVAFENNEFDLPVIIGFLNIDQKTKVEHYCEELKVNYQAKLPNETQIGEVSSSSINCLKGLNTNLADYIKNNTLTYTLDLTGYKSGDEIPLPIMLSIPDGCMIYAVVDAYAGTKRYYQLLEKTQIQISDSSEDNALETIPQYNYVFWNCYGTIKIEGNILSI